VATTVHLKKSVITAQHLAAALAVGFGIALFVAYRAVPFTIAFATIGAFNVAIAVWTRHNPVLATDDEGITLKRAVLSKTVRLPWNELESLSIADEKWLDIKVKGEPTIRLFATNLEETALEQLLDEGRRRG
jgi:hypothetical protein